MSLPSAWLKVSALPAAFRVAVTPVRPDTWLTAVTTEPRLPPDGIVALIVVAVPPPFRLNETLPTLATARVAEVDARALTPVAPDCALTAAAIVDAWSSAATVTFAEPFEPDTVTVWAATPLPAGAALAPAEAPPRPVAPVP